MGNSRPSRDPVAKSLRAVLRKMDRELRERRPGAIARLAELNRERNALRLRALTPEGKAK